MSNAHMKGILCPVCKEEVTVLVTAYPGDMGSYWSPPEPPALEEVDEILFENCPGEGHDLPHLEERSVWVRQSRSFRRYHPGEIMPRVHTDYLRGGVRRTTEMKDTPESRWFWKLVYEQIETAEMEFDYDEEPYDPDF